MSVLHTSLQVPIRIAIGHNPNILGQQHNEALMHRRRVDPAKTNRFKYSIDWKEMIFMGTYGLLVRIGSKITLLHEFGCHQRKIWRRCQCIQMRVHSGFEVKLTGHWSANEKKKFFIQICWEKLKENHVWLYDKWTRVMFVCFQFLLLF